MPDGYSRWGSDPHSQESSMIETGTFLMPCPCCKASLEIKMSPEKDDITITSETTMPAMTHGAKLPVSEGLYTATVSDRKCAYCFRNAIRGGTLCTSHNFCGSCHKVEFPDGKPFALKEWPTCEACAK